MAFTGKLGASNSNPGNLMLGAASFTPTEPTPSSPILTLLPRDPDIQPRLRRFADLLSDVHNSLVRTGQLVQTGVASWVISVGVTSFNGRDGDITFAETDLPDAGTPGTYRVVTTDQYGRVASGTVGDSNMLFADNGVPDESIAYVGDYYLDLDTGKLYLKS